GFATAGVQANVPSSVHSRTTFHVTPSKTHHLYCSGAMPPLAVAVHTMVVPGSCGATLSAISATVFVRTSKAAFTSMRGLTMPLRGSVIEFPVRCNADKMSVTDADDFACLRSATAPATWGRAIEVPVSAAIALPGTDERTLVPGA